MNHLSHLDADVLTPIRHLFFPTRVRILVVVDSAISITASGGFGVGKIIDIIESNEFFPCGEFRIHCAQRSTAVAMVNTAANSHQFRYTGFRFDMAGFDVNDYDQVWFFGFNPGNDGLTSDATVNLASQSPLSNNELKILAQWMDSKQGGVLAMGDHHYLGASMCSKIPRVRNMRRWTNAQGVPPIGGFDRHDTNQPASYVGSIPTSAEGDSVPQPIEVLRKVYANFLKKSFIPHPVLCGVDGVIDILPDHPHEGETLGRRYDTGSGGIPVNTTLTTNIPSYDVAEYPAGVSGNPKPEPEIIAYAHPINTPLHAKNQTVSNPSHANDSAAFGVISVYDGEQAGVGRVVVDSTWHHWFNLNLAGFPNTSPEAKKIRNYFKNTAAWLCRKSLRSSMLYCHIWDFLLIEFDPMRFSRLDSIWHLGQQAYDVLGRRASQCLRSEWIFDFVDVRFHDQIRFPPRPTPCLTCPPIEALEVAILGGIMKSLYPLVEEYMLQSRAGRVKVNPKQIQRAAMEGVRLGQAEYLKAIEQSRKDTEKLLGNLSKAFRAVREDEFIPQLDVRKLRITVESITALVPRVQFLLTDEHSTIEVRAMVDGHALGDPVVLTGKANFKSTANNRFVTAKSGKTIAEDQFESGEHLQLQAYLLSADGSSRRLVWQRGFDGDPRTWVGRHAGESADSEVEVVITIAEPKKK